METWEPTPLSRLVPLHTHTHINRPKDRRQVKLVANLQSSEERHLFVGALDTFCDDGPLGLLIDLIDSHRVVLQHVMPWFHVQLVHAGIPTCWNACNYYSVLHAIIARETTS